MSETTTAPITTYYNGSCPVCSAEIEHYRRYDQREDLGLAWCDIAENPQALRRFDLDRDDVRKRLHVIDGEGRLHKGIDAFAVLWQAMPRYRFLARAVRTPVIRPLAVFVYERILAPALFAWNKRRHP